MKRYYTLKLKLTPKQIEMLEEIFGEGRLSVSDQLAYEDSPAKEDRLIAIEDKIDQALKRSGYSLDWYDNRHSA